MTRVTRDDSPIPVEGWYSSCSQNFGPQAGFDEWLAILLPALEDDRVQRIKWTQGTPHSGPFIAMEMALWLDLSTVIHTPEDWSKAAAELSELEARDTELYSRHRRSSPNSKSVTKYEPGHQMYITPEEYVSACMRIGDRMDELKDTFPGLGADLDDDEQFFLYSGGNGHPQVRCLAADDPLRAKVGILDQLLDRRFYHVLMSVFGDRCSVELTRRDDGTPYFRVESFTHE